MILNHYTAEDNLGFLLGSGVLMTTESNIGAPPEGDSRRKGVKPVGDHVGPDVVWLTSLTNPISAGIDALPGTQVIRVVVDVPAEEVSRWPAWSKGRGIDPRWYRSLAKGRYPDGWYVVERPVPWTEWTGIERVGERATLWRPEDGIDVRYSDEEIRANLAVARSRAPR